jgi:hypothetical protein
LNKSETLYQQLIVNGIQTLPAEALLEVASFVYFIRQRFLAPQVFEEELYRGLLSMELRSLTQAEVWHLEQEFVNYEQRYPDE